MANDIIGRISSPAPIIGKISGLSTEAALLAVQELTARTAAAETDIDALQTAAASLANTKADKTATDTAIAGKADQATTYTKTEVDAKDALKANKEQEAWIAPTLLNGWTNIPGAITRYKKNDSGVVFVECLVTGGTSGQPIFNVPSGYRPTRQTYASGLSSSVIGGLFIQTNGDIQHWVGGVLNNRFVFSYRID